MTRKRVRHLVLLLAVIVLSVLVLAMDILRERFYMWRLTWNDRNVQCEAAEALKRRGSARSVPALFRTIVETRGNDMHDLGLQPDFQAIVARGEDAIAYLVTQLTTEGPERRMALRLLSRLAEEVGAKAAKAVPAIEECLFLTDPEELLFTVAALNSIAVVPSNRAMMRLRELLLSRTAHRTIQANIADLLGKARDPDARREAVSTLVELMANGDDQAKMIAIAAIEAIGVPEGEMAVNALRNVIQKPGEDEGIVAAARSALDAVSGRE